MSGRFHINSFKSVFCRGRYFILNNISNYYYFVTIFYHFSRTYLGSNPYFSTTSSSARTPSSSNNKKRSISTEQVLRLFGSNNPAAKTNAERPRRSPASSPPSTTHQMNYRPSSYVPSIHELTTRTVTMVREPQDGTHGFGICVKGGKDAGKLRN